MVCFGRVRLRHLHPPRVGRGGVWAFSTQYQQYPGGSCSFLSYWQHASRLGRRRLSKLHLRLGEATNPGPDPQDRPGVVAPTEPRALKVLT
eukprot:2416138-Amphidinium_carterae.1